MPDQARPVPTLHPAAPGPDRPLIEIGCDESGFEGENLAGGNTNVFAHASVGLDPETAVACVQEVRHRIRSPAVEYKANHLLRRKHRAVLAWLLGRSGPLLGHARVTLVDQTFFVLARVADVLVGPFPAAVSAGRVPGPEAMAIAGTLYREGRRAFGERLWFDLLESSNDLLRMRNRQDPVGPYFLMIDALVRSGARGEIDEVVGQLRAAERRAEEFRAYLREHPAMIPVLDLLAPAIVRVVDHWSRGGEPVSIVHDEQAVLTRRRIAQLTDLLAVSAPDVDGTSSGRRLTGIRLVDSRLDARVQVADFLAGIARTVASDQLNGRGDVELTALLRPYLDRGSVWGDTRSWSLLEPALKHQP